MNLEIKPIGIIGAMDNEIELLKNSIDIKNIKARFKNGTVVITLPKLVIPKHKVTVE